MTESLIPPTCPTGWTCPKCGRVWAPWVICCECSQPPKVVPDLDQWDSTGIFTEPTGFTPPKVRYGTTSL